MTSSSKCGRPSFMNRRYPSPPPNTRTLAFRIELFFVVICLVFFIFSFGCRVAAASSEECFLRTYSLSCDMKPKLAACVAVCVDQGAADTVSGCTSSELDSEFCRVCACARELLTTPLPFRCPPSLSDRGRHRPHPHRVLRGPFLVSLEPNSSGTSGTAAAAAVVARTAARSTTTAIMMEEAAAPTSWIGRGRGSGADTPTPKQRRRPYGKREGFEM